MTPTASFMKAPKRSAVVAILATASLAALITQWHRRHVAQPPFVAGIARYANGDVAPSVGVEARGLERAGITTLSGRFYLPLPAGAGRQDSVLVDFRYGRTSEKESHYLRVNARTPVMLRGQAQTRER